MVLTAALYFPGSALAQQAPLALPDATMDFAEDNAAWGIPSESSGSDATDSAAWREQLVRALARHKRYPAALRNAARATGAPFPTGSVMVWFSIDRDGKLIDLGIAGSSGIPEFDEAALDMVRVAEPLPKPPPDVTPAMFPLLLPVEFRSR